jgi:hypothetical protein
LFSTGCRRTNRRPSNIEPYFTVHVPAPSAPGARNATSMAASAANRTTAATTTAIEPTWLTSRPARSGPAAAAMVESVSIRFRTRSMQSFRPAKLGA